MQNRRGFTLIEILIAVFLIDVGLLALVAGSAMLVGQTNQLKARRAALSAATDRLQTLGSTPCVAQSGFAIGDRHIREHWEEVLRENSIRELGDSVTFDAGGRGGWIALRTRLPC